MAWERTELEGYLRSKGKVKVHAGNAYLDDPGCGSERGMVVCLDPAGRPKAFVGAWNCKSCGDTGNTKTLLERFGDPVPPELESKKRERSWRVRKPSKAMELATRLTQKHNAGEKNKKKRALPKVAKKKSAKPFTWYDGLAVECHERLRTNKEALLYLAGRGFTPESAERFLLGVYPVERFGKTLMYLSIPVWDSDGTLVTVRFRSIPSVCPFCEGRGCDKKRKSCDGGRVKKMFANCTGRPLPLHNSHRLPDDVNEPIIITEGELDAIAFDQYGFKNVVSITSGAGAFMDDWLDTLEPYRRFYLCWDDDKAGDAGVTEAAEKLGKFRCSRVTLPRNDCADCLKEKVPVEEIERALERAQPMLKSRFEGAGAYKEQLRELRGNKDKRVGLTTTSENLNASIGGLRPGLVAITGDTSSGKTSVSTWLLHQQAKRNVPVMITSFEEEPIGTVQKLLCQELGDDWAEFDDESWEKALDRINERPIYILDHYGGISSEDVIESIRYAVRRHGVKVVVLDHLGFLQDPNADDERRDIEGIIRALAVVGVYEGVCIILICHPNRNAHIQRRRITIRDLKGASAIEQDCHLGLVVSRVKPGPKTDHRYAVKIYNDKCRGNYGVVGSSAFLFYDRQACTYADSWDSLPEAQHSAKT